MKLDDRSRGVAMDCWQNRQDPRTRDGLIKEQLPLVAKIAAHYQTQAPYEDLVQVGAIGLMRAYDRYDPSLGVTFRTYATHLVTGEIKHYLRDQVPLVRPPRELVELTSRINQATQDLAAGLGREPTSDEVAARLNLPVDKVRDSLGLEHRTLSLDEEPGEGHCALIDQIEDKRYRSFQLAQEDRMVVAEAMGDIREQSRQIIDFIFFQDLTQTEAAKQLGISQMQVSRRLKTAMQELWATLNTRVTPW